MENRESSIGHLVSVLYRNGNSYLDRELKSYNIGSGQFMFLAVLLNKSGLTQEAISDYLRIDKATTARALNRLEENGYIMRLADPKDKRVNIIHLTEQGKNLKAVIAKISRQWTEMVTEGFTEEEKTLVKSLLKQMAHKACSHQQLSKND